MSKKKRTQWFLTPGLSGLIVVMLLGILVASCSPDTPTVNASEFNTLAVTVKLIAPDTSVTPKMLFQRTIHDARQTQQVYQEITALHHVGPDKVYNRPAMFPIYTFYDLRFQHDNTPLAEATTDRTGCAFWEIKVPGNTTLSTYCCAWNTQWAEWQKDLNIPDLTATPTIK